MDKYVLIAYLLVRGPFIYSKGVEFASAIQPLPLEVTSSPSQSSSSSSSSSSQAMIYMSEYPLPEIQRTPLEEVILQVCTFHVYMLVYVCI